MQKIMFNETYGLTTAVLQGRKTMTRRMISKNFPTEGIELIGVTGIGAEFRIGENYEPVFVRLPYKVGEVVAIAQSYKDAGYTKEWVVQNIKPNPKSKPTDPFEKKYPGWTNKMFVKADLMPHRIRITDLKVERLQDISDEECIKEGVGCAAMPFGYYIKGIELKKPYYEADTGFTWTHKPFKSPREAFAALIDKVSGRGTWDLNPWVFAYSYELVK